MSFNTSRSRIRSGYQAADSFEEQLYRQLRKTPWVAASVGVHAFIFGILLLLPQDAADAQALAKKITIAPAVERVEIEDTEPREPKPERDPKDPEKKFVEPTLVENPTPPEEPIDPAERPLGLEHLMANAPFEDMGQNAIIGIGPNLGGKFGFRDGGSGKGGQGGGGGDGGGTQPAVDRALDWLARHQSPEGHWDCDGFSATCKLNACSGPGDATYDPGVSGLALLPFLARGESHTRGPHSDTVKRGLRYLRQIQDAEGCFGPRTSQHFQYNHAIATLAMVEGYGLSGNSRVLREPAQKGVDFIHASQNPYLAWRYGVRDGDNDTSVTGWMVMALKSAKMADLEVDDGAFRHAIGWIDKMTEPEFGRVGYQRRGGPPARTTEAMERFPADQSESLTAVGVLTRIFCGQDPRTNDAIGKGADLMLRKAPRWDVDAGTIDMYYWYYGTLAMHQVGGDRWKRWNAAMKTAIVDHQRSESGRDEHGSWGPVGPWAAAGGRVYSTATMALCLEVYYRYQRVR